MYSYKSIFSKLVLNNIGHSTKEKRSEKNKKTTKNNNTSWLKDNNMFLDKGARNQMDVT